MKSRFLMLGMGAMLVAGAARAVPPRFAVQGVLRDGSGNLQSLMASVTVTIYDAPTAGNTVAGPYGPTSVAVENGLFTIYVDEASLKSKVGTTAKLYLEVVEGSDIFPRQQLASEPFALVAGNADLADGLSAACSGCVTDAMVKNVAAAKVSGKVQSAANADTVTSGLYSNASYADPNWLASLSAGKIVGKVASAAAADTVTNGVYTTSAYSDPTWLTGLAGAKIIGAVTSALNFTGMLGGDVSGGMNATVVSALLGRPLSAIPPTANQVLAYDGASWAPVAAPSLTYATGAVDVWLQPNTWGPLSHLNWTAPATGYALVRTHYMIYIGNKNAMNVYSTCNVFSQIATSSFKPDGSKSGFLSEQITYGMQSDGFLYGTHQSGEIIVPVVANTTYTFYLNGMNNCPGLADWNQVVVVVDFRNVVTNATLFPN